MLNQMDEKRLSISKRNAVKARSFGGAGINEIYPKLDTLLK